MGYIQINIENFVRNTKIHKNNTRQNLGLHVHIRRTDATEKSLMNRGIQSYNKLPTSLDNYKNLVFKKGK